MNTNNRVTAIVPSYNERPRIGGVLSALLRARHISEIIVVDDGSSDGTADFVKKMFPSVNCLVNETNRGKAFSMNRGVEKSSGGIIFFCDADLTGLDSETVDVLVLPIINNTYDMYIGIRNNKMQKSFLPFALNSGERAIRKELWEKLPDFYKHRFRIEVGLNYMVRYCTKKGIGYAVMPYYQTLKEKKYGFLEGQRQRFGMNVDVSAAWFRAIYDFWFLERALRRIGRRNDIIYP